MNRKLGFDKEGNYHGKYCYFTKEYLTPSDEEIKVLKQIASRSDIMKGISPHYSKQLEFNFEGEEDENNRL